MKRHSSERDPFVIESNPRPEQSIHTRNEAWGRCTLISGTLLAMNSSTSITLDWMNCRSRPSHCSPCWYAAVMPAVANAEPKCRYACSTTARYCARFSASLITTNPQCSPARFHVLPGLDVVTTPASYPTALQHSAIGLCFSPHRVRSAWISSEIIITPCSLQSSATATCSSQLQTRPIGLCGEHQISAFTSSALNTFRISTRSSSASGAGGGAAADAGDPAASLQLRRVTSRRPAPTTRSCSGT
mmetsp:Transcript_24924/g.50639  ORF Transcript_24924/g.50639 Transcript_24924/m.50639 type:complete len:245 (-) Transcript_24924:11-745(-)